MVSDNKFLFRNYEKYIVLWAGKIGCAICFDHLFIQNKAANPVGIYMFKVNNREGKCRLGKDNFSRHDLKQISRTLPTQVFSCEHCEIFRNNYFKEQLQATASGASRFYVNSQPIRPQVVMSIFREAVMRLFLNPN